MPGTHAYQAFFAKKSKNSIQIFPKTQFKIAKTQKYEIFRNKISFLTDSSTIFAQIFDFSAIFLQILIKTQFKNEKTQFKNGKTQKHEIFRFTGHLKACNKKALGN